MDNLISVIIAAYNAERYLSEALNSVLAQKGVNFEIIVVDDGSTDNTLKIITQYTASNVFSIQQTNQGQGAAFNHALKIAKGNFIAFLDYDDIFIPDKLALQLQIFEFMPEIDMVYGHTEQFISPELPDIIKQQRVCIQYPEPGHTTSVTLFRKTCFDKVGNFNDKLKFGVLIDWIIRAKELKLQDFCLPQILARRRIHDQNQTVIARENYKDYIEIIKAKIARSQAITTIQS